MADFRVQLKMARNVADGTDAPILALDIAAPDHSEAVAAAEAFAALDNGVGTFLAFTVVALQGEGIPDGYDTAEEKAAKNIAYDALEEHFRVENGIDPHNPDTLVDLTGLADAVVGALVAAGVVIPTSVDDPHGTPGEPSRPVATVIRVVE